jgi:hypothetical protein
MNVIYTAVNGTAPFPDNDETDSLINAPDFATLQQLFAPPVTALGANSNSTMTKLTNYGNIGAMIGSASVSLFTGLKSLLPQPLSTVANKVFSVLNSASYMLYVAPDVISSIPTWNKTGNKWYVDFNSVCTMLGVGKAIVDASSPWWTGDDSSYGTYGSAGLDFVLNLAWQAPTTGQFVDQLDGRKASVQDADTIVGFIGGTTFDISGMMAPALAVAMTIVDPDSRTLAVAGVIAGMSFFNLVWGGSCIAISFDGLSTS